MGEREETLRGRYRDCGREAEDTRLGSGVIELIGGVVGGGCVSPHHV